MAASSVESAVATSITTGLRDAASSWVQSFAGRVMSGANPPAAQPAHAPVREPAAIATPAVVVANENAVHVDAVSVAQKLILEVRKVAAVEARAAPAPKAGKKKILRRSESQASSSDSWRAEVLRKERRSRKFDRPVTLPLACGSSPCSPSCGGEAMGLEAQRSRGPAGSALDQLVAWRHARDLLALVEEQQNVTRQMQVAAPDKGPLEGSQDDVCSLIYSPCHPACMVFLGCENVSELKEPLRVGAYMTFIAKKQCREWWLRKM